MTEGEITERITLLGELMMQVHEDMVKLTGAMAMLDARLGVLERWKNDAETTMRQRDRGIGRSP